MSSGHDKTDALNSRPAQEHDNLSSGLEYPEVHQALPTVEEL